MSEYEVMYLKENINFKYEMLNMKMIGDMYYSKVDLYYNIKITKPPERKTKTLILFFDCLNLVKELKKFLKFIKEYRFGCLRIFFESYKNSKNIYDTTPKMIYFTNITDEVKEYFSSSRCNSSLICFNIIYDFNETEEPIKSFDYGFRVNYVLNNMKYINDILSDDYKCNDKFSIKSYINIINGISFFIVFAAYYLATIKTDYGPQKKMVNQNLIEMQNYLNPIVEVGFKELIEKTRLNEKYKQILYLSVLKDDF